MYSFTDKKGMFATIFFHGVILFLLMFFSFSTPKPEENLEGILVNFGNNDKGFVNKEPENNMTNNIPESTSADNQSESTTEEMLTQKEDSPVTEQEIEKKETEHKITHNNNVQTENKVEKETEKITQTVNQNMLFSGHNSNTSNSQGVTEVNRNQGKENGDINSDNYDVGGIGIGVSASLDGRTGLSLPSPPANFQIECIVVVEVTVDRQGKVIKAIPGIKKSTTLDSQLLKLAKEAALKANFNIKEDAPVLQKGTITYSFRLK